jgi:hypothetical protein
MKKTCCFASWEQLRRRALPAYSTYSGILQWVARKKCNVHGTEMPRELVQTRNLLKKTTRAVFFCTGGIFIIIIPDNK